MARGVSTLSPFPAPDARRERAGSAAPTARTRRSTEIQLRLITFLATNTVRIITMANKHHMAILVPKNPAKLPPMTGPAANMRNEVNRRMLVSLAVISDGTFLVM